MYIPKCIRFYCKLYNQIRLHTFKVKLLMYLNFHDFFFFYLLPITLLAMLFIFKVYHIMCIYIYIYIYTVHINNIYIYIYIYIYSAVKSQKSFYLHNILYVCVLCIFNMYI